MDRLVARGADDDPVGPHEVFDGRTFLEEFRVGDNAERDVDLALAEFCGHGGMDCIAGTDRNGALVDDDLVIGHHPTDVACGGEDVLQVGGAVFVGRCPDGDELNRAVVYRLLDISGEAKPASGDVAAHDLLQSRFVDRYAARLEDADLRGIEVEAEDVVTNFGKAGATDEADVTGSDDGNFQGASLM
ncbi:MAG: hypothetical protein AW07_04768 [Candidatus Accumulibacter sp. SK-11]|nr:MAG: hypothetical protein AW07_04768 [Candidatus Accumulibacter sp. SK-11]